MDGNRAMPNDDAFVRLIEQGRGLSTDDFVRMIEGDCPMGASDLVSIDDLALERGVSVRTIRRWNKLPDAPKRYRRGRRLMYRRTDVQAWPGRSKRSSGPGDDVRDEEGA